MSLRRSSNILHNHSYSFLATGSENLPFFTGISLCFTRAEHSVEQNFTVGHTC
eukprot:m.1661327 g.1661327  ORF g.1661327 m.1661327 type:complete len:53 (+) comp124656_c0_seq1:27-185(+)